MAIELPDETKQKLRAAFTFIIEELQRQGSSKLETTIMYGSYSKAKDEITQKTYKLTVEEVTE